LRRKDRNFAVGEYLPLSELNASALQMRTPHQVKLDVGVLIFFLTSRQKQKPTARVSIISNKGIWAVNRPIYPRSPLVSEPLCLVLSAVIEHVSEHLESFREV